MFGLESWDGNVEGLIAALTCLIIVGLVAKEAWKTRHDGTWNDVFKMYGLVMGGMFVWIICLIIAPMPTVIIFGLLVWWSIATV
jgi:hypothetical protein